MVYGICILDCFVITPTLFLYFLPFYPYILTFLMLFITYVILLAAGACLSCGLLSHSCRSLSSQGSIYGPLTQVLATLAVLAEEPLTKASVQTLSQTLLRMDDKASSPCLRTWGTHRSRPSKTMDNTYLSL